MTIIDSYVLLSSYSGNAWIGLQSGGGYWALLSTANLTIRQDISRINSPPSTYMPAVVRFKQTCYYSLLIPGISKHELS